MIISRQAAMGAVVAVVLMLGAGAGPSGNALSAAPPHGVVYAAQWTYLTGVARSCRDKVFDDALDVIGDAAARLKQI